MHLQHSSFPPEQSVCRLRKILYGVLQVMSHLAEAIHNQFQLIFQVHSQVHSQVHKNLHTNFENYMSSRNISKPKSEAGCLLIGEKHAEKEEGKHYIPLQQ